MARFILAGVMDDVQLAKAEAVANQLSMNLPAYKSSVKYVAEEDWQAFLSDQIKLHGWKCSDPARYRQRNVSTSLLSAHNGKGNKTSPVPEGRIGGQTIKDERAWGNTCVWRESGELIGDAEAYLDLMKHAYNTHLDLTEELLQEITRENYTEGMRQLTKERTRRKILEEEEAARQKAAREAEEARARRSARSRRSAASRRTTTNTENLGSSPSSRPSTASNGGINPSSSRQFTTRELSRPASPAVH